MSIKFRKALDLLVVAVLTFVSFPSEASAQREKLTDDLSLKVVLSSNAPMLPRGAEAMPLTIEVMNIGKEAVTIDKNALWREIILKNAFDPDEQFISIVCGQLPKRNDVDLQSNASIWAHIDYSLRRTWFENGGSYTLSVKIEGVESNKIHFEFINEDREVEVQNDHKR